MRYDVYDIDENLWACWDSLRGYLTGWMNQRAYQRWYALELGCPGKRLPGRRTIYRADADEREARRQKG